MDEMISGAFSAKTRQTIFHRQFHTQRLNYEVDHAVSAYDPEQAAYIRDASAKEQGSIATIEQDLRKFFADRRSEKHEKYAQELEELERCFGAYQRLRRNLGPASPDALSENAIKEVRQDIKTILGDGENTGLSVALARFHQKTEYAHVRANPMRIMVNMISGVEALSVDLMNLSIDDHNYVVDNVGKICDDFFNLWNTYDDQADAYLEYLSEEELKIHPADVDQYVLAAQNSVKDCEEKLPRLNEEQSRLESDAEAYKKSLEQERANAADFRNGLQTRSELIKTYNQGIDARKADIRSVEDKLKEEAKLLEDTKKALADNQARHAKFAQELDTLDKARRDAAAAYNSKTIPNKDRVELYNQCETFEQRYRYVSQSISPENAQQLKTAKGRKALMANKDDPKTAEMARMTEEYISLYNKVHPSGITGALTGFFTGSPGEVAVSGIIDAWAKDPRSSLSMKFSLFTETLTLRKEFAKNPEAATINAYLDTRETYIRRSPYLQSENEKMITEQSTLFEKIKALPKEMEKQRETLGKQEDLVKNLQNIVDTLTKKQEEEQKLLDSGEFEKREAELVNKINDTNKRRGQVEAEISSTRLLATKSNITLDKLKDYKARLNEDVKKYNEVKNALKLGQDLPELHGFGQDNREDMILARLRGFRARAAENKGFHINSGAYNRMIEALDNAINGGSENLQENLNTLGTKAFDYQHEKGAPLVGKRSEFGTMRLSYAEEIKNFANTFRFAMKKNPATATDAVIEDQRKLNAINMEKTDFSLTQRCAEAFPKMSAPQKMKTAEPQREKNLERDTSKKQSGPSPLRKK